MRRWESASPPATIASTSQRILDWWLPSRPLKLALVKDVVGGRLQWSGHYLVNPWNNDGLVDLNTYPKLKAYYEQHAAVLKKRHTAEKKRNGWYKTIDCVNHGLTNKHKLYIPDIKNILDPVLDQGETYPHHNLYFYISFSLMSGTLKYLEVCSCLPSDSCSSNRMGSACEVVLAIPSPVPTPDSSS